MASRTLWDTLNSPFSVKGIQTLISGQEGGVGASKGGNVKNLDEVLRRAEALAAQRGVSTEVVLLEMGFSFKSEGSEEEAAADEKPGNTSQLGKSGTLASFWEASPLSSEELGPFWGRIAVGEAALERLFFITPELKENFSEVSQSRATPLWQRLVKYGVSPQALLASLEAEPFFPPVSPGRSSFVESLLETEQLRYKDFARIKRQSAARQVSFLSLLVEDGTMKSSALLEALGKFSGLSVDEGPTPCDDKGLWERFPLELLRYFWMAPLRDEGGVMIVATPYAPSAVIKTRLEAAVNGAVRFVLVERIVAERLREKGLEWQESNQSSVMITAKPQSSPMKIAALEDLRRGGVHIPAVALVERVFAGAVDARATDVHVEPSDDGARVRFRIDGICHEVLTLGGRAYSEVVARLKVLADMDITERRQPQDGHIRAEVQGLALDMRVATVPARGGEKVSIRLASTSRESIHLEALGMGPADLARVRDAATKPFGMVLATGPVGSGKTTTLYSCLHAIDRTRRHVMTIEDPVEINLEHANQVEVNYNIGLGFVEGLRALLRQDPDTILIGEIRDEETARIAIRASMTGLMVFSSLHANTAPGAISALQNFHIPNHLLGNALKGVVAQRLLRRLCPHCKVSHPLSAEAMDSIGLPEEMREDFKAYRSTGCQSCLGTGYNGRIGVFEVFTVDEETRDLILDGASERQLREHAVSKGMTSLQQDGWSKIQQGETSVEEFLRVLRF